VDLIGYGDSSKPPGDEHYSIQRQAEQVEALIDKLSLGSRVRLVGHSLGSAVAWHLAASRPELLETLVLIGSSPGYEDSKGVAGITGPIDALTHRSYDRMEELQHSWFASVEASQPWFPPTIVHEAMKAPLHVWQASRRGALNVTTTKARALLPRIRAPTLVLRGEKDSLTSAEDQHELGELLTGAASVSLITTPGTGHGFHWETSGARALAEVLRKADGTRQADGRGEPKEAATLRGHGGDGSRVRQARPAPSWVDAIGCVVIPWLLLALVNLVLTCYPHRKSRRDEADDMFFGHVDDEDSLQQDGNPTLLDGPRRLYSKLSRTLRLDGNGLQAPAPVQ